MKEFGQRYQELLEPHVSSSRPKVPLYSTVLNEVIREDGALNAQYWRKSLESPVLFNTTMQMLLSQQASGSVLLEIGSHPLLSVPVQQILEQYQPDALYVPTLVRGQNDTASLLTAAGHLFVKGFALDFDSINAGGSLLTDLAFLTTSKF